MAVNPRDLLALAKEQITRQSEAHQRCAVSRAYYACFHAAQDLAEHFDLPMPTTLVRGSHEEIHKRFADYLNADDEPFMRRIKSIGVVLGGQKKARVTADYGITEDILIGDAESSIHTCSSLLDRIDATYREFSQSDTSQSRA